MSIGDLDNVVFGLRRGCLSYQLAYPFALRQDKKLQWNLVCVKIFGNEEPITSEIT